MSPPISPPSVTWSELEQPSAFQAKSLRAEPLPLLLTNCKTNDIPASAVLYV